jgi:hypothetical protein
MDYLASDGKIGKKLTIRTQHVAGDHVAGQMLE